MRNLPKLTQLISGKTGREPVRLAPESVPWETRWTTKAAGRHGVMECPGAGVGWVEKGLGMNRG